MSFAALKLHPTLLKSVADLGFTEPTPIQKDSIPIALEGRDLLACAATGSGKTAAFLLPILNHIIDQPRGTSRALVVAPTRELARQILDDLQDLAKGTGVRGAVVHGGVGMKPQEKAFRDGTDFIIATPGRLLDHFQYGYAKLPGLEYLVLDEADRMLDMGFLPDIKRILRHVPTPKQTFFFSATMPPPIEKLTREMLNNPARIALQRIAAPADGIGQAVYPVPGKLKTSLLIALLQQEGVHDALVFTRTKHRANRLTKKLNSEGISAERIHGNRSQNQRNQALDGFKKGKFQVLVATDIAARGIDVEALGHVINFDLPNVPEDYIHRVGRTARAGETGTALSLVAPDEQQDLKRIERAVKMEIPKRQLEGFNYDMAEGEALEVPRAQRIAEIRARKKADRERAKAKEARRTGSGSGSQGSGAKTEETSSRPRRRRFGKRRS